MFQDQQSFIYDLLLNVRNHVDLNSSKTSSSLI